MYRRLTRKDRAILWCLTRQPGMTGKELCAVTGLYRTFVYMRLANLEARDLVRTEIPEQIGLWYTDTFKFFVTRTGELLSDL